MRRVVSCRIGVGVGAVNWLVVGGKGRGKMDMAVVADKP